MKAVVVVVVFKCALLPVRNYFVDAQHPRYYRCETNLEDKSSRVIICLLSTPRGGGCRPIGMIFQGVSRVLALGHRHGRGRYQEGVSRGYSLVGDTPCPDGKPGTDIWTHEL